MTDKETASTSPIEAVFPLSPMQAGILFHCRVQDSDRPYRKQWYADIAGAFDEGKFRAALAHVATAYPALRSVVVWDGLDAPQNVVLRKAAPQVSITSEDGSDAAVEALTTAEFEAGIDLTAPPTSRFVVVLRRGGSWRLIWTHHHIFFDGWSSGLILRTLLEAYAGVAPQPSPRLQVQDVFEAGRARRKSGASYWRARLGDLDEPSYLMAALTPATRDRTVATATATLDHRLPVTLVEAVSARARALRLPSSTLHVAAFALVLALYTGRGDPVFGAVLSGRDGALTGIEDVAGMLAQTVPLRFGLAADAPIDTWLQTVDAELRAASEHATLPLNEIAKHSGLAPNAPLFDCLFVLQNQATALGAPPDGLRVKGIRSIEASHYPFNLLVSPGDETVATALYDQTVIGAETADQLLQHYVTVLTALATGGVARVRDISLASAADAAWVSERFCRSSAFDWAAPPLSTAIAEAAAEMPAARGFVFADAAYSYGEIDDLANRMAQHLAARGVRTGAYVAVLLPVSRDLITTIVALHRLGACPIMLDPAHPPMRVRQIIGDTGVARIISNGALVQGATSEALTALGVTMIDAAALMDEPCQPSSPAVLQDVSIEQLSYVIHTSGSTGRPKGVVMTHRAVANLCSWQNRHLPTSNGATTACLASPAFDIVFQEMVSTIASRGTLLVVPQDLKLDVRGLIDLLAEHRVERLYLSVALLRELAFAPPEALQKLRCVRQLNVAGEALILTPEIRQLIAALDLAAMTNQYGPTEAHVVTSLLMSGDHKAWPTLPTIGRSVSGVDVRILDRHGHLQPPGVPGEIHVAGPSLACGYLDASRQTAAAFLPDPMGQTPGGRVYATGDIGAYLRDGTIAFFGRRDDQVKIRGQRVELREIEVVLSEVPEVTEAAVVAIATASGARRLVAFVVTEDAAMDMSDLRASLRMRLPDAAVPSSIQRLTGMPRNATGKVDANRLEALAAEVSVAGPGLRRPEGDLEHKVAGVWCAVLGLEAVGREDNFFDVGGDSLDLMRVERRLAQDHGIEVRVTELFEYPTVAELAGMIARRAEPEGPMAQAAPGHPATGRAVEGQTARRARRMQARARRSPG